jgi:hypothetical protein
MHLRITSIHAQAQDACEHTLESVGALEFVNDSSGSAAPPAPYNAVAELKHACRFHTFSRTLQEVTSDASTYGAVCGLRRHRLG